jgi:hypothetical protein
MRLTIFISLFVVLILLAGCVGEEITTDNQTNITQVQENKTNITQDQTNKTQNNLSQALNCTIFPSDNPWNTDISNYPVHNNSDNFIKYTGADENLHPDFGTVWAGGPNGIPYDLITWDQPMIPIVFTAYGDESDPGPYPIPLNATIEHGDDRHVIAVDMKRCMLYELYMAYPKSDHWEADSGAIFNLSSNKLRPYTWTSADAAGLPMFPGLVRYDEVESGEINHALRFTVERTQQAIVTPARHYASEITNPDAPPMGLRFRLKSDYDISTFSKKNQVILTALKKYGMIVADNGGEWFLSGAPDPRWDDEELAELRRVKGSDFEVVYTGPVETYN